MTTIREVIGRCNSQLADELKLRYPDPELLDYYNDALRAMITVRADVGANFETLTCTASSLQTLPEGAIRLLDITRVSGGRAITPIPKEVLDNYDPDWHLRTGMPQRYCYDEQIPRQFYLCPAPATGIEVEAKIARIPEAVKVDGIDINVQVDELYINAIIAWILFRAFSKDVEGGNNAQIAAQHLQIFNDQMGLKTQADTDQGRRKSQQYTGGQQQ